MAAPTRRSLSVTMKRMKWPLLLAIFCLISILNRPHAYQSRDEMEAAVKRAAIGTLVSNSTDDVANLCNALYSLRHLADASFEHPAHVLVFHDGLSEKQTENLKTCTNRTIQFPHVGYSFERSFPLNFDVNQESPNWQK